MKNNATVGIVILNYNNYNDTINCINSIEKYNTASIKYIIVDNGSTNPNSVKELDYFLQNKFTDKYAKIYENQKTSILPYVTLLISTTNDGYAKGNNKGLELAYSDNDIKSILILNNDTLFIEDIIPYLYESYYHRLTKVAILSPILYKKNLSKIEIHCARNNITISEAIKKNLLYYYYLVTGKDEVTRNKHRYLLYKGVPNKEFLEVEMPSGSCMFIDKLLFKVIGSFDPNTFLYWEENILFIKTKKIGLTNYISTKIRCIHLGGSSTSKSPSMFIVNCGIESSLYYFKNYSGCSKFSYLLYKASCIFFKSLYTLQKKIYK